MSIPRSNHILVIRANKHAGKRVKGMEGRGQKEPKEFLRSAGVENRPSRITGGWGRNGGRSMAGRRGERNTLAESLELNLP